MRFGRWSAPQPTSHQNISGSKVTTVEAAQISKKSGETKSGEKQTVVHRRERSRYDIPEQRKRPATTSPKKPIITEESPILPVDIPIIDRIPTAIGYLSDGSDEEWLEEKSRCSRYKVSQHEDFEDDVDEEEENRDDDDDMGDDGDDKYSQSGTKMNRDKKTHRDTISALWSHSTDSETDEENWQTIDAIHDRESNVIDDNISYAEEKGTDPIYDKNQGKQKKKKNVKSPNSPAGISDTSSVSDNLQKMLHFAPTNDEAVATIEGNIQILKATTAEEFGTSIPDKKKSSRKAHRATKPTKISKRKTMTVSKDQIELSRSISAMPAKSKDEIELSRTVSVPEPTKRTSKAKTMAKKSNDIISALPASTALVADDFTDEESAKSGRQSRAKMYTKSLLTEDSDTDTLQISILPDPLKPLGTKEVALDELRTAEASNSRKHRIGILLSNSWNFAGTTRTKLGQNRKEKTGAERSAGFFSKMRKQRRTKLDKDTSSNYDTLVSTEVNRPICLTSPRSKGSTEPKELDEYSRSTKETNQNEPDVVQCLRYFQCGSAANHVNVAISVANCGTVNDAIEEEENDVLDIVPGTPNATVEVYLNDEQKSGISRKKAIPSCGNSMSCKNETPDDDDLTEVPGLGLATASSIIIDVTSMQLHLDGDSEMDRKLTSTRGVGSSRSRSDVSVTSITVPVLTSTQSEENEQIKGKAEETEMELKDYMTKMKKRKGIRGFFRVRFAKKQ